MRRATICVLLALLAPLFANQAFEVTSVKPANQVRSFACNFAPGGRFQGFGTAQWFIACAYGLVQSRADVEILNRPRWLDEDLFEIAATATPGALPATVSERLTMIQALLADRFQLVAHREQRHLPIYHLVMANKDGKLGPRIHATDAACTAWIARGRQGKPPSPGGEPPCGRQAVRGSLIQATVITLAQLSNLLSPRVGRPIEDRTGLNGTFYVDLEWAPETGAPPAETPPIPEDLPPSVFTALREQLGLKLESATGVLDVLVIDHVEKPAPN